MPTIDLTPLPICDVMNVPALPVLPAGISLGIGLPGIGEVFSVRLCCKIFQLPVGLPPVDLGISVQSTLILAIDELITTINSYRSLLPMTCPREHV